MNVANIKEATAKFKNYLSRDKEFRWSIFWESNQNFQEQWDLATDDLAGMYDRSLSSGQSRRLWKRENYFPKDRMLQFIELQPDFVTMMFVDLFNEEKSADGRIHRFVYYCDELLKEYKEKHPASIVNNHYHDDYQMISLYLSFRFPEQYAYFHFPLFRKLMEMLKARDLPLTQEVERYFKTLRTLYTFLEKEADILELHQARLDPKKHFRGKSLMLAAEMAAVYTGVEVLP